MGVRLMLLVIVCDVMMCMVLLTVRCHVRCESFSNEHASTEFIKGGDGYVLTRCAYDDDDDDE